MAKTKIVSCYNCSKKVTMPKEMTAAQQPICPYCKKGVYSAGQEIGSSIMQNLPKLLIRLLR